MDFSYKNRHGQYHQQMRQRESQTNPNTSKHKANEESEHQINKSKNHLTDDESGINYPVIGHWAYSNLTILLLFCNIIMGITLGFYYWKGVSNMADEFETKKWNAAGITRDVELTLNKQRLKIEDTYETRTTEILQKISMDSNIVRNLLNDRFAAYEKELDYQTSKIANLERKILDLNRNLKISRVVMPCEGTVVDFKED